MDSRKIAIILFASVACGASAGLWVRTQAAAPAVTTGGQYYVSPTGSTTNDGSQNSPWPSVAFALSKVGGGNTIILEPGTYGPILVRRGYGGTAGHPTVIQSQIKWQAVIDGTGYPNANYINLEGVCSETNGTNGTTDYTTFDGLKVINSTGAGIALGGTWNIAQNCWVTRSKCGGLGAYNVSNAVIRNNLFEYNGTDTGRDHGIYAGGTGLVVIGNVVRHNAAFGIHLYTYIKNSTISGNLVYGQKNQTDMLFGYAEGSPNTVTNNILLDDSVGGISVLGANPFRAWSGNQVETAIRGDSLDSISSNNVSDYSKALALILPPWPKKTDRTPPSGTVTDSGLYGGDQAVWVLYTGNQSLDLTRINPGNVIVKGPNGYNCSPQATVNMLLQHSRALQVTYRLTPPAGGWTSANNGTYDVYLQANQVSDLAGNHAPSGKMSKSFVININSAAAQARVQGSGQPAKMGKN